MACCISHFSESRLRVGQAAQAARRKGILRITAQLCTEVAIDGVILGDGEEYFPLFATKFQLHGIMILGDKINNVFLRKHEYSREQLNRVDRHSMEVQIRFRWRCCSTHCLMLTSVSGVDPAHTTHRKRHNPRETSAHLRCCVNAGL